MIAYQTIAEGNSPMSWNAADAAPLMVPSSATVQESFELMMSSLKLAAPIFCKMESKKRDRDCETDAVGFALTVTTAYADYKRPYTSSTLQFFKTFAEATTELRRRKVEFFKDELHLVLQLKIAPSECEMPDDFTEEQMIELDENMYLVHESRNAWMENRPFEGFIKEITFCETERTGL